MLPIDFLFICINYRIRLTIKNKKIYEGKLLDCDRRMNLILLLENGEEIFIKGRNISLVKIENEVFDEIFDEANSYYNHELKNKNNAI